MPNDLKRLTNFLVDLGIERVPHTQKNYLAHLISVYNLMKSSGIEEELCRAGLFHSIYGTEKFQGFKLTLDDRPRVRELIGERAEQLAFWNCFMDRSTLDAMLTQTAGPYRLRNRETGEFYELTPADLDDLACVHVFDWIEQVPRSSYGWDYRREPYRLMAERVGETALKAYDAVFATETR